MAGPERPEGTPAGEPTEPELSGIRPNPRALTTAAYDKHGKKLFAFLCRAGMRDPEAVHQEVFLALFLYLNDHDPPTKMWAFLLTIARNKMGHEYRWQGREPLAADVDVGDPTGPDSRTNPEQLFDARRNARRIRDVCDDLPTDQSTAFRRIALNEEDVGQVAKSLQAKERTIRSRLDRARDGFATLFQKRFPRKPRG